MGKFDKYRIDLKAMKADAETFEFPLDNVFFADIDADEVQKGKLHAILNVKRTSRAYELSFHIEGNVVVSCDRCLDDMELPVVSDEKIIVKLGTEHGSEGDNIIIVPEQEGDINVAWLIYEFIALAVPMKHVHAPGKCNKAMTSKLNKHLQSDDEDDNNTSELDDDDMDGDTGSDKSDDSIDPRWNELKKILDNN